jgi:hypothetical protein
MFFFFGFFVYMSIAKYETRVFEKKVLLIFSMMIL